MNFSLYKKELWQKKVFPFLYVLSKHRYYTR